MTRDAPADLSRTVLFFWTKKPVAIPSLYRISQCKNGGGRDGISDDFPRCAKLVYHPEIQEVYAKTVVVAYF